MNSSGPASAGIRAQFEKNCLVWGDFAYRHARPILAVVLTVVAALCAQIPQIRIETSTENFLEEDDPIRVTYDRFREQFGRDEKILLALTPPEVFDLDFLERLRALQRDIERDVPQLRRVESLLDARSTRAGPNGELIVEDLFEHWPDGPRELAELERRALSNPLYRHRLLDDAGTLTSMLIETDAYSSDNSEESALSGFGETDTPDASAERAFLTGEENVAIIDALDAVVARHRAPDFPIHMAGSPAMAVHLQRAMESDMLRFTLISVAGIALFLGLLFRRWISVFLPLLISLLSMLSTLGAMALAGILINLPTEIMPSLLISIGVGNSVHVLAIFFQMRREGLDERTAVARAFGHSGLAVLMTNLTTAGGLLSFVAAELKPISDFGVVAPLGVLSSLLFTALLLPPLIAVLPGTRSAARPHGAREGDAELRLSQRLLVRCGEFAVRHAQAVVLGSVGLLALSALGALQISFSYDPLAWLPEENALRRANQMIDERLGGDVFVELLVDSHERGGLYDPDLLRRLDEIRHLAMRLQVGQIHAASGLSIADVVKEINQALHDGRAEAFSLPERRELVAQELLLFEASGSEDLGQLVDPGFSKARVTLQLPFADAVQYEPYLDRLESGVREILGDRADVESTGLVVLLTRTLNAVMESMARSYALAFAIITPLMVLLIGRLRIGLLSMIPNLAPILVTLGIMGWSDIPLDAFTLLVGSIALGLAVDDTIHFLHNFRRYFEQGMSVEAAVRRTLLTTGQAMLFTSIVLSGGFFLFMLASMQNLFYFGWLTGLTVLFALLADVLLSPALIALAARRPLARAAAWPEQRAARVGLTSPQSISTDRGGTE